MHTLINATTTQTMSSREIAELTGKRHDHVMADIRKMLADLSLHAPEFSGVYKDQQLIDRPCFNLPKRETLILVSGYSVAMRAKIIDRWQELEAKQTAFDITNPVHLLQAIEVQARLNIQLAAERDHALATKAQIGSQREATAMATASAAVRKANTLQAELGRCKSHATIIAIENATRDQYQWQPLKKWCKDRAIKPIEVVDPRWGKVKSWPAQAWLEVYGVNISALF